MTSKWYFTKEELKNSPSAKAGINANKEQKYKQEAAFLIRDMGQQLKVSRSCINSAIVFMHRFYVYHSQSKFKKCSVACVALFLAAKVSDSPKSPEHVIKSMHLCFEKSSNQIDVTSEDFKKKVSELLSDELILLMTLGFITEVKHPHASIFDFCQKINVSKEFLHRADKIATHCLQLTSMCLRYKPTDFAIFCIYLTAKWSHFKIQETVDGKPWFQCLDFKITYELLKKMEKEFKGHLDMCSFRLKNRVMDLFEQSFESCKSDQNNSPDWSPESEKSVQRSKISYQEYSARKKNRNIVNINNDNSDNNINKDSEIRLNTSIKSVLTSAKNQIPSRKTSTANFDTGLIDKPSRKRKSNIDLDDISSPVKKFKPNEKVHNK